MMVQLTEMTQAKEQAIIDAPIEKVFGILSDVDIYGTLFPGTKYAGRSETLSCWTTS
jgi:carbon monoxide dehydrogenase subunit G